MNTLPNDVLPIEHNDPINARILAISEDKIAGFVREPFSEIAERADLPVETVLERIVAICAEERSGGSARRCLRPTWRRVRSLPGRFRRRRSTRPSIGCRNTIRFPVMSSCVRPIP